MLALGGAAALRFHTPLFSPAPNTDERVYLRAFHAVAAGSSPYARASDQLDFYYPPPFAALGADALGALGAGGERTLVALFRTVNVAGLLATLWIAAGCAPLALRWRLAAALGYVALAPPALRHGLGAGNLSLAVVGSLLTAFVAWPRRSVASGLLLGLGALIKPLAPAGLVALAAHRPRAGGRRHLLTVAVALASAALLALALVPLSSPLWRAYSGVGADLDSWPLRRSISLYRWLHLAGAPVTPLATLALVALGALWWARRAPLSERQLLVLAMVATALAAPALWSHTLLLTLPLQAMALARAWRRSRSVTVAPPPLSRYELPLVAVAALALQLADGIGGGVEIAPAPIQLLALAVPLAAVPALGAYVWSEDRVEPIGSSG